MVKRDRRLMALYPCGFRGVAKRAGCPDLWRSKISVNPIRAGARIRGHLLDAGALCQRVAAAYTEGASAFQALRRLA